MRKLPVYFLLDVSESMIGEPIAEVERGVHSLLKDLLANPYALETAHIGVIAFAGKARTLAPLTELIEFQAPKLPIGGGTDLGAGIDLLTRELDRSVQKTTREKKGDWRPIVFLFTDGAPTSDSSAAVRKWREKYADRCSLISVVFGENADVELLRSLGGEVYRLDDLSPESIREFFKWVSASVSASSVAVANNVEDGIRTSGINLRKAEPGNTDENYLVLSLKCPAKKKMYLAKYARGENSHAYLGSWPVDEESYKEMSGQTQGQTVSVAALDHTPKCPHCGNDEGVIECGACRRLFHSTGSRIVTCPWCGNEGTVTYNEDFAIERNLG